MRKYMVLSVTEKNVVLGFGYRSLFMMGCSREERRESSRFWLSQLSLYIVPVFVVALVSGALFVWVVTKFDDS